MNRVGLLFFLLLLISSTTLSARESISLNRNWKFSYGYSVHKGGGDIITLPHTWNVQDALGGNLDYYRGVGNYEKTLHADADWKGKKIIVKFYGSNSVTDLFVNGKLVGEHRGGYNAFAFDISGYLNYGEVNDIYVKVNNAPQNIMPLVGDFNFYGGIYRDVELIITDSDAISLLDYGSEGVYLHQSDVSAESASVKSVIKIEGDSDKQVRLTLFDRENSPVLRESVSVAGGESEAVVEFTVDKPHLWNGVKDPYLYRVDVEIIKDGVAVDKVSQPLGLRYFEVDPDLGFILNGEKLQLRGVCRHQDRPERGSAIADEDHAEDVAIMVDMGANSLRMSHYPHDQYMYNLMDSEGFVVWSEIPFVGPGGYRDKGFIDLESFKENGKVQMIEMIRQNINHPSVCFWGLFNELKEDGDNPVDYLKELNELAHSEDPSRVTTSATNQAKGDLNMVSDIICWNKYYGWYGGDASYIGTWADKAHKEMPERAIGISEYGAGASLYHQQETLEKVTPKSLWHPENWQTDFHEKHWIAIDQREFLWGTYIWNLFDFGAAHRAEGQIKGRNDKGLVSFDRKSKKDSFYFFKANWNKKDPIVYIAERRVDERTAADQVIKIYSNQKEVTLYLNGDKIAKKTEGDYCRFFFNVTLKEGVNVITAESGSKIIDSVNLNLNLKTK